MSPVVVMFVAFPVCLALGIPIAWSIGIPVAIYLGMTGMFQPTYIANTLYTACDTFPLMAIPLFVLAGTLMEGGGLSKRLIDFADSICGHITGGLAVITVITCMFFGALSGSAAATVVAIGSIMVPYMRKMGYSKGFSYALITASGCLGVLIPPSIPLVLYGIATNASIGNLFLGGFGSGFAVGGALIIVALIICHKRGYKGNGMKFSFRRVLITFKNALGALMVPIIILGGIYGGIFTPTEAAGVACIYGLFAGIFLYKELTFKKIVDGLINSVSTNAQILVIVGTATCLARMMTVENIPRLISETVQNATDSKFVVLLLINVVLLIAGCVMDASPVITILAPILYPIVAAYGVDPIHFGVMFITNTTIGYITPPVGLNIFVAVGMGDCSLRELIRPLAPFFIAMVAALMLITYCPDVVLFIPRLCGYGG